MKIHENLKEIRENHVKTINLEEVLSYYVSCTH